MAQTRRSDVDNAPEAKKAKTDSGSVPIQEGDSLPDIEVTLQSENTINLAKKFGKGPLVIFSYPKASTPGCTKQTSGFGSLYEKFQELGAAVFGLSADTPKAQTTFKEKTKVDFDLISDPKFELLSVLGAQRPPKSVIRSHFVFMDGKAVLLERSVKPDDSPKITFKKVQELVGEGGSSKSGKNPEAKSNGKAESNGKATKKENEAESDGEEGENDDEEGENDDEADGYELNGDSHDDFDSQEVDEFGEENDLEEGEEDAEEIDLENELAEEGVASEVGDDDEEGEEEGEAREKVAQEEDEDEVQEEIDDAKADAKADAKPDAAKAGDE